MATTSASENHVDSGDTVVLITGFGPFLDIKTNPSFEIVTRLPTTLMHHGTRIRIATLTTPLAVSYHKVASTIPKLLEEVNPDVVIHVGLAADRNYFAIEHGAEKVGYDQIPDVERKVFTKVENKTFWGKDSPGRLDSVVDFDRCLGLWKEYAEGGDGKGKVKNKTKGKVVAEDLRLSDDVGNFICGFVYYLTLERFWKMKKKARVVFLHVPPLSEEAEIDRGVKVVTGLVKAMVEEGNK